MTSKEEETLVIDRLRIIIVKITVEKMEGNEANNYYKQKRREIRKKLKGKPDDIRSLIVLNTDKTIEETWIVECLMGLQCEFTDLLFVPESTVSDEKLSGFIEFFQPRQVIRQVTK